MDIAVAWSAGSLIATAGAIVIWATRIAWYRLRGEHVDWW